MAIHYEDFQHVSVTPSNSSYGRWAVRTSEVTFRFFWRKSDAVLFANAHNVKQHAKTCAQCAMAVNQAIGNLCAVGRIV